MDKKELYEHLASIYLDASKKGKKKSRYHKSLSRRIVIFSLVLVLIFSAFIVSRLYRNQPVRTEIALVLHPDATKINFNFDPAKKEIYAIDLKGLDLTHFKALAFALKKSDSTDKIAIRIEFNSGYKEKSEIYLKDIGPKWKDYKVLLSNFKKISDWSKMMNLAFIVEEWNTREKNDVVYLDNIRLLR